MIIAVDNYLKLYKYLLSMERPMIAIRLDFETNTKETIIREHGMEGYLREPIAVEKIED